MAATPPRWAAFVKIAADRGFRPTVRHLGDRHAGLRQDRRVREQRRSDDLLPRPEPAARRRGRREGLQGRGRRSHRLHDLRRHAAMVALVAAGNFAPLHRAEAHRAGAAHRALRSARRHCRLDAKGDVTAQGYVLYGRRTGASRRPASEGWAPHRAGPARRRPCAAAEPAQQLGEMRADPQLQGVQLPHRRAEFPSRSSIASAKPDHARVRPGRLAQCGGAPPGRRRARPARPARTGSAAPRWSATGRNGSGPGGCVAPSRDRPKSIDRRDVLLVPADEALAWTEVVEPRLVWAWAP